MLKQGYRAEAELGGALPGVGESRRGVGCTLGAVGTRGRGSGACRDAGGGTGVLEGVGVDPAMLSLGAGTGVTTGSTALPGAAAGAAAPAAELPRSLAALLSEREGSDDCEDGGSPAGSVFDWERFAASSCLAFLSASCSGETLKRSAS